MSHIFRPQRHGFPRDDIDPFRSRHFHQRLIRPDQPPLTFSPQIPQGLRLIGSKKIGRERFHARPSNSSLLETPAHDDLIQLQVETSLRKLFKRRKQVYPSDVSSTLGLSYEDVLKVFERMVRQEKLKVVTGKVVHPTK